MDTILWQLLLQAFLIFLNAVFACAEIAVISMNDMRITQLAAAGDKRAKKLEKLTEHYTERQLRELEEIFVACSRYEASFWDMAWQKKL